jgi:Flp pilus assembly protein TadD
MSRKSKQPRRAAPVPEAAPPRPSAAAVWALAAALVIATAVAYAPVRQFDFVQLDDPQYVTENPQVRSGLTASGLRWALTSGYAANWHPLTWISHMLDVSLFGMNAGAHHLMNLALHLASTVLLFLWLRRTTGDLGPSAFVAALFALHPVHVESVAWVAERKDVLSTLLWMLTLWVYVRYVNRPTLGRYALVAVTFALGLMAKPMLVTLPFVLLLLDVWPLGRLGHLSGGRAFRPGELADLKVRPTYVSARPTYMSLIREKLPLFALAAASSAITIVVQERGGAVTSLDALPVSLRVENAVMSYVSYLGKMIWPADLTIFYGRPEAMSPAVIGLTAVALTAATIAAIRLGRTRPYLPVGWLWYLGTLVPVIGLVQVGVQAMADRYTYVPLIGVFIAIAWSARDLTARSAAAGRALAITAVLIIIACAAATRRQVGFWQDNTTLFAHATELTLGVDQVRAHNAVGTALLNQGRLDEALANFLAAKRLAPEDAETHYNIGLAAARRDRLDEAIASWNEAIRLRPDYADAYAALGLAAAQQGRANDAIAHYRVAIRLKPDVPETHNNLGTTLANQRRLEDARASFAEAVRLRPDFHAARLNMAVAYATLGQRAEAVRELQEVLRRDPANERARAMLASLGAK